jgi:ubiquitin conjugation factor E4 B
MITFLMGDISFLIEEVIQALIGIKRYQELKDNRELWNAKDEEEKKVEEEKFTINDGKLKTVSRFLNHSLGFMSIICSCLQKYFIKEEKAERLACLLNYCLQEFTVKSSELIIKNRRTYEFNPSYIMESLIKIYSYFIDYEEFIEFVVSDKGYYKFDNFLKAIKLKNELNKVKVDDKISENFDKLVYDKLKKAEEFVKQNSVNYDDAPEEFNDPLTYGLMEDPVILPTSHVTLDKKTILDYLLTNPTDPFNRNPLTKEELIPNNELKKKNDEYKKNKLKKLKKKQNEESNNEIKENNENKKDEKNEENKIIENKENESKENNEDKNNENENKCKIGVK